MTTPGGGAPTGGPTGVRAADADRQTAIDALSQAHADGQLSYDEYDQRSRSASAATTLAELVPLTADLQHPVHFAALADTIYDVADPVGTGTSREARPQRSPGRRLARAVVALFLVGGLCVLLIAIVGRVAGKSAVGATPEADLQSAAGFDTFVSDVKDKFGSTEVESATVYPGYAVIYVPMKSNPLHVQSYYYDGSFADPTANDTRKADDPLADLGTIDGATFHRLLVQAPDALNVPAATSTYAIVGTWGDPAQTSLSVYASDDFSSGYLVAAADGHLLDAYPADQ